MSIKQFVGFLKHNKFNTKVKCTRKLSAILTRMVFLLHTVIAIWRVSLAWDLDYVYFVSIGAFMLVMEMIYTLAVRGGMETKW